MPSRWNGGERVQIYIHSSFWSCFNHITMCHLKWVPVHRHWKFSPHLWLSPGSFPFRLFLWILQTLSSYILLSTDLIFNTDHSPFLLATSSTHLVSLITPCPSYPVLISSARNHPAAFCPLWAGKLQTLTSRSLSCLSTPWMYKTTVSCMPGRIFLFVSE